MKNSLKQTAIVFMAILFGISWSYGQSFEKGDKLLNLGIGIGSQFVAAGGSGGIPPVGLSFEVGINNKISIGAYGGYASTKVDVFVAEWTYTYIVAAARGSYHFDVGVEKLDPYAGVILGYNIASASTTANNMPEPKVGGPIYGAHAGARYLFTPGMGVFAEVGYGIAWLNAGLTFKF